jgi:hypothetical protein
MASFKAIIDRIDDAIATFAEKIPASQRDMLYAIDEELARLDLLNGKIKPTVANLKIVNSIKNKLLRVILTDEYKSQVKDFIQSFRDITTLHNQYWRSIEKKFKPSSILKEVKKVAISDTIEKLTENGINVSVAGPVADILNQNITQGGSMKDLRDGLRTMLTDAGDTPGLLKKYATQITTDSINQYSRNYTQIVTSDLGLEWFGYRNTLIKTSRPFCIAMVERRYFHVSEIPALLKATDLTYLNQKTGKREKVKLNPKTKLPDGMYATTNVANFLTLLGGYNCGHQAGPVSETLVKMQDPALYNKVISSNSYKAWKRVNAV